MSQKTTLLWLAITSTYINQFRYFWQKCCQERKQSNDALFCHLIKLVLVQPGEMESRKLYLFT